MTAYLLHNEPTSYSSLARLSTWKYGAEHAHTIIKNIPKGLTATVIYDIAVYHLYPSIGPYAGTATAYTLVIGYLAMALSSSGKADKRQKNPQ